MSESVFGRRERKNIMERPLRIVRVSEESGRALREFWEIMSESLRNPKNGEKTDKFDARITSMLTNKEEGKLFFMLEREMRESQRTGKMGWERQYEKKEMQLLDINRAEADAFFAYTGAGSEEEKIIAMLNLRSDVEKAADAIATLDLNLGKLGESQLAKIIALVEKDDVRKEDIEVLLGKKAEVELTEALYTLLSRQEAASVAARNFLNMECAGYEKIFRISTKNEMLALLNTYRRMLGDARFARAKEALSRGDFAELLAEIRKMSHASQYLFLALLAPSLMRNGMWNSKVLGIIAGALAAVRNAALKSGIDADGAQSRYIQKAGKFVSRFADFRGLNLSLFSAAFVVLLR